MTRRQPAQYNWGRLEFDETIMKKHFYTGRNQKISFVVAHHMTIVGNGNGKANDACYSTWQTRKASAHYGVDGNYVRQFVWDKDAAWSTGSGTGNNGGISIEHANSAAGGSWPVSEATWKNGAKLAAYIHKVHGLGRPTSTNGGKGGTLRKHSSFFATACPGPFFDSIWSKYVAEAQRVYDSIGSGSGAPSTPTERPSMNNVRRSPNAPETLYAGRKTVAPHTAVGRIWSVVEAILVAVRATVKRSSHLPEDIYAGQDEFSVPQAINRSWTVSEATLKEVRELRALIEEQAKRDGLPVEALLATAKPLVSPEVPDETPVTDDEEVE